VVTSTQQATPGTRRTATTRPARTPAGSSPPAARIQQTARTAAGLALAPLTIAEQALPRSRPLVYYAGLTAAAAAGVIDWPIAVIAAAAVWAIRQPAVTPNTGDGARPGPAPAAE
jgi:hypothetical protein